METRTTLGKSYGAGFGEAQERSPGMYRTARALVPLRAAGRPQVFADVVEEELVRTAYVH